jgi:hypothetical protein
MPVQGLLYEGPCCTFGDEMLLAGSENVVFCGVLCERRQMYQVTPDVTLATFPTKPNSEIHTLQNCLARHFSPVQYFDAVRYTNNSRNVGFIKIFTMFI